MKLDLYDLQNQKEQTGRTTAQEGKTLTLDSRTPGGVDRLRQSIAAS